MTEKTLNRLRARAEEECQTEIAAARQKLQARLEALEWMRADSSHKDDTSAKLPVGSAIRRSHGELTQSVERVLPGLPQEFSFADVINALRVNDPLADVNTTSVSSILKRLKDCGKLDLISRGAGKRASVYRRSTQ